MFDYHIHPDYSIDAEPFSIADYCVKALRIGLKEICFTTHCEFDPIRKDFDWFVRCNGEIVPMHPNTWMDMYFADITRCAGIYGPQGLIVKAGLEAGFDMGLDKYIEKVLSRYPFDFVIGSVHCLDHIAISSEKESPGYFQGATLQEAADKYFNTLGEAVASGMFDVIGHLDIYRRHGTEFFGKETVSAYKEHLDGILQLMLKNSTGIEINTSAARHYRGAFYPAESILVRAVEKGVKLFTIGSDCHRISELGQGINQAMKTAKKLGINFSVFKKRKPRLWEG